MILAPPRTSSVLAAPRCSSGPWGRILVLGSGAISIRLRGVAGGYEITVGNLPDEICVEEVQ
jgi:hypothetical protein